MKLQTANPLLGAFIKLTAVIAIALVLIWLLSIVVGVVIHAVIIAAIVAAIVLAGLFLYSAIRRRPMWEVLNPITRLWGRS